MGYGNYGAQVEVVIRKEHPTSSIHAMLESPCCIVDRKIIVMIKMR